MVKIIDIPVEKLRKKGIILSRRLEHLEATLFKALDSTIKVEPLRLRSQLKSASILARFVGMQLKSGKGFRRVASLIFKLRRRCPNLEGFRIACSGRLRGVEMAKTDVKKWGKTPASVFSQKLDYARFDVITKHGILGIKVWLCFS